MEPIRNIAGIVSRQGHPRLYGIRHWASFLTSIPRTHPLQQSHHHQIAIGRNQRPYATKTVHEKVVRRARLAPKAAYQPTTATTWIVSDGSLSADKEAVALARGLSMPWVIKRVQWRQGLQWLPIPFKKLIMDYHHVVNRKQTDKLPWFLTGDALSAPYPSFVIGSGAKTLPGMLQVSRMSGKASFSVHIHFPALPFIHFDQVFLQRHEVVVQLAGLGLMKDQKNYFRIASTLNTLTPRSLDLARATALEQGLIPKAYFTSDISRNGVEDNTQSQQTASPIIAVLIGGPNVDCSHNTDRMVNRLARLLDVQNCRVLITFSQRTAENTKRAITNLQDRIHDESRLFVYDPMVDRGSSAAADAATPGKATSASVASVNWGAVAGPKGVLGFMSGRNPYEAMLALADKIVVTADSVAMTNEALATGKPVYILGGELARGKLKVFHRYLADHHATRAFRPGRVFITSNNKSVEDNSINSGINGNNKDTADSLSYPGDHPPWNHNNLAGQGPEEVKKLADRIKVMRECRLAGRRIPEHIADATC